MIELTTMNVRFIGSKPDGIRICRVEGESLTTVIVPRELLSEAKRLPDIPKRGVYYLLDEDHGVIGRVYAGQTAQGLSRLDAHKSRKGFWNKAVMFLDDDSNMDRDVLDALEARAIGYVRTRGSYETDDLETPQPCVSPYKGQTVRRLHERILFRMAALGYGLDRTDDAVTAGHAVFRAKRNGIVVKGRCDERTGSFMVLAGSRARGSASPGPSSRTSAPRTRGGSSSGKGLGRPSCGTTWRSAARARLRRSCSGEAGTAGSNG